MRRRSCGILSEEGSPRNREPAVESKGTTWFLTAKRISLPIRLENWNMAGGEKDYDIKVVISCLK